MLRGIETAANGMKSIIISNDIIANNLSNVNTPGFKKATAIFKGFHDVMVKQMNEPRNEENSENVGTISTGCTVASSFVDFKQGNLKFTGNNFDIALNGKGFFTVENENGERLYTRNGSLTMDENGLLKTKEGYKVVGEKGPIQLLTNGQGSESNSISFTEDGLVIAKENKLDELIISDFENTDNLETVGTSYYKPINNEEAKRIKDFNLRQNFIESTNSNVVENMVEMIKGQRTYESLSKVVMERNKGLQKAITQVGVVRG